MLDSQSTNQIIAEIDFEVNSESRLSHSVGDEGDASQEANPAQCLKIPETVSATERETHSQSLTCLLGHGALFVSEQQVNNTITKQSRRLQVSSNFTASTKLMEKLRISKCSRSLRQHFNVRSSHSPGLVSQSGSHQSTQEVHAVNGFTESVLQCDGHSGFLHLKIKLVVKCHQLLKSVLLTVIRVEVLWRGFKRPFMVKSEPSGLDLQIN